MSRNLKPKYKLDKKERTRIDSAIKRYTEFAGSEVVLPGTILINQQEGDGHG